jgi:hypothetical protein
MPYSIRIVSTYPPRRCGIGTFSRDLATALAHFTAEVGHIRVAAIDNHHGPYGIPVDLIIDQYNPPSWRNAVTHICTRAAEARNPTVVILQLVQAGLSRSRQPRSFVHLARRFTEVDHCGLPAPFPISEPHEETIREPCRYSDGLIVTTESPYRFSNPTRTESAGS